MADEKTFSETEHIAILSDRVAKETANLTAKVDQLDSEKTELANKLDVAESAKTAAELRAETADKALADFKAEVEEKAAAAARKDERLNKVREGAKHLDDKFFEDTARVDRIVSMKDEDFEGYLLDLTATAVPATAGAANHIPRETAMVGAEAAKPTQSAARNFLLGHYTPQES